MPTPGGSWLSTSRERRPRLNGATIARGLAGLRSGHMPRRRRRLPALALKIRKVGVGFDDHLPLHFDQSIFRPVKATRLAKARKELESALILLAKVNGHNARTINNRAKVLLGYINNGMTPIGIGYQHDLRPDFEFYEEFITDYQGHKDALFGNTLQMLLNVDDKSDKANLAKAARDHAQGMAGAAKIDVTLAESQRQPPKWPGKRQRAVYMRSKKRSRPSKRPERTPTQRSVSETSSRESVWWSAR